MQSSRINDVVWCYFRNLVHTVYREIRHLGPKDDPEAKLRVSDRFQRPAERCRNWRGTLESRWFFDNTATLKKTSDVLAVYEDAVALQLEDLRQLFAESGWEGSYGGGKWGHIVQLLMDLRTAIDSGDDARASIVCHEISSIEHNSGPLVPPPEEWERNDYLQRKWPELCE